MTGWADLTVRLAAPAERRVVGVLVLRPAEPDLLLEAVAVDPVAQGRGVGRRLVEHAMAQARRTGLEAVSLYTNEAMTQNQHWYLRLGFVEVGRADVDGFRRVFYRRPVPV